MTREATPLSFRTPTTKFLTLLSPKKTKKKHGPLEQQYERLRTGLFEQQVCKPPSSPKYILYSTQLSQVHADFSFLIKVMSSHREESGSKIPRAFRFNAKTSLSTRYPDVYGESEYLLCKTNGTLGQGLVSLETFTTGNSKPRKARPTTEKNMT